MKANDVALSPRVCRSVFQISASPVVLGLSAVVLVMQLGQAGQKPFGVSRAGVPVAETLRLDLGTVGISSPSQPARHGFDRAKGRINHAADGAGYAARAVLNTPDMRDGTLQVLAGALGSAAAPVAAVVGGVRARNQVLSPNELSETERDLAHAMAEMAEQSQLRERILEAAKGKTRRRFVAMNAFDEAAVRMVANRPSAGSTVRTVLESKVEEIRLERAGSTDSSFALLIKARVRLLRSDNGNALYDQPFEYRSEKGLFLDWTLNKAQPFRQCAVTGYRKLAEQIVEQVFLKTAEGPIVVGVGFKKPPARAGQLQVVLAANRGMSSVQPLPEFATRPVANLGTIGVYSTSAVSYVAVQLPMTKQKAVSEAIRDVEWSLDGLDNHPNPLVALTACAAAIPMGLCKQTAGAARGLTDKQYRAAEAQVTAAARKTKPDQDLAYAVAQQLTPRSSQPVVLVTKPWPAGGQRALAEPELVKHVTLSWLPKDQTVANYIGSEGVNTALEIEVFSAALKGDHGINPRLAMCVDARATLLRVSDGQEIYSCPVHYRSGGRTFTEWAANDARLFRDEFDRCSRELSEAIVDQLVARRLIGPDETPKAILADNSD